MPADLYLPMTVRLHKEKRTILNVILRMVRLFENSTYGDRTIRKSRG